MVLQDDALVPHLTVAELRDLIRLPDIADRKPFPVIIFEAVASNLEPSATR